MSRYRVFHVTRYRVMSDETRYWVTLTPILTLISGATRYRVIMSPISYTIYPISGSISGPISDTISGDTRYRCRYRRQYRISRYRSLTASDNNGPISSSISAASLSSNMWSGRSVQIRADKILLDRMITNEHLSLGGARERAGAWAAGAWPRIYWTKW